MTSTSLNPTLHIARQSTGNNKYNGESVQRPNHGLAHHVRVASYVAIVVKAYNFFRQCNLSSTDIENLQLALMFYVAGRENETTNEDWNEFETFRNKSAIAFERYVKQNLPTQFTENKLKFYKNGIYNAYIDPSPHEYTIIRICHDLDLLRCYERSKYNKKIEEIATFVGSSVANLLAKLAEDCLAATGDRIMGKKSYDGRVFVVCSKSPDEILHKVAGVFQQTQELIISYLNPAIPLDLRAELPDPSIPWMLTPSLVEAMQKPTPDTLYKKAPVYPEHKEWRFIWKYFHQRKPFKYGIKCIYAISERHQRQVFEANLSSIEREAETMPPTWDTEPRADQRALAIKRWRESVQVFSPFHTRESDGRMRTWNATKVVPLWHGTNEKKCDYICRSGFVYFGKQDLGGKFLSADNTDEGFFGSGIYFTNSARYAADIYANGHLLLAWVSMREPFPVVGDPLQSDMKGLKGKDKYKNYDTRYIPVDPKSPTDPYCAIYYPPQKGEAATCDEYVVLHKSQTLPQFWIELEVEIPNLKVLHTHPKFVSELIPHLMKILQNPDVDRDLKLRNILNNQLGILIKLKPDDDLTEGQNKLYQQINTLITIQGIVDQTIRNELAKSGSFVQSSPLSKSVSPLDAYSSTSSEPFPPTVASPKGNEAIVQYNLGMQYTSGESVQQSDEEAFKCFKTAAEQGLDIAQWQLGSCYEEGKGVKRNDTESFKWYQKAALQGHIKAQSSLGNCYDKGKGVPQNAAEAVKWYRKAAGHGDPLGQCKLGDLYTDGRGVEQSLEEAVKWYIKAAEQKYDYAQYKLGCCFKEGDGVRQSDKEAYMWFKKAADQNLNSAQREMGNCYYYGKGVAQSYTEAFSWFKKAAEQEDAEAQFMLVFCHDEITGAAHSSTSSQPIPPAIAVKSSTSTQPMPTAVESPKGDKAIDQYNLGMKYANGKDVQQSDVEAFKCFKKAAELGLDIAQWELGSCYEEGKGVKQNATESHKWFLKAAEQGISDTQFKVGNYYDRGNGAGYAEAAFAWYQSAALQGHIKAQSSLGYCYDKGYGVQQNATEAVNWYRKAAGQGDPFGQCKLGDRYADGKGIEMNYEEAAKWFRRAAEQEHEYAQFNLGYCYKEGHGVRQSDKDAFMWFKKAADQGLHIAQREVGNCYYDGNGVAQSYTQAFSWFQKAAEQGDAEAQNMLGYCYEEGHGVEKDDKLAFKWYKKAAEQGDSNSQYNVGSCYSDGNGVKQNDVEAFSWFYKAAQQDDADAQNMLGQLYEEGTGVEADDKMAFSYYTQAAEQDLAAAQNNLGLCYLEGIGTKKNLTKAFDLFEKAAEQGDVSAQFYLGMCYEEGKGVKRDDDAAFNWYKEAAEQEDAEAQFALGNCYADGRGTIQDEKKAALWYKKAAQQGHLEAQEILEASPKKGKGAKQNKEKSFTQHNSKKAGKMTLRSHKKKH